MTAEYETDADYQRYLKNENDKDNRARTDLDEIEDSTDIWDYYEPNCHRDV